VADELINAAKVSALFLYFLEPLMIEHNVCYIVCKYPDAVFSLELCILLYSHRYNTSNIF
jgi:hypothetical protein